MAAAGLGILVDGVVWVGCMVSGVDMLEAFVGLDILADGHNLVDVVALVAGTVLDNVRADVSERFEGVGSDPHRVLGCKDGRNLQTHRN